MTTRGQLRRISRDAHLISRGAGDLAALTGGPVPLARRVARRSLTRLIFRALRTR